jgi:Fe-S-cluster containining protein
MIDFENFHKKFKGESSIGKKLCKECGGMCEKYKVCSLLPGEAEYMASKRNIPLQLFKDKYLDSVDVDGYSVDIIKCFKVCPFSTIGKTCAIKDYKPILCLIYPLFITSEREIGLDTNCRLVDDKDLLDFFNDYGTQLLTDLEIPKEWLDAVSKYDEFDYDYDSLLYYRDSSLNQHKTYQLNDLLKYKLIKESAL